MNTVPYANAARAGRTHHGKIEILSKDDPRHPLHPKPGPNNRAARRARGLYRGVSLPAVRHTMKGYRRILGRKIASHA